MLPCRLRMYKRRINCTVVELKPVPPTANLLGITRVLIVPLWN